MKKPDNANEFIAVILVLAGSYALWNARGFGVAAFVLAILLMLNNIVGEP